MAISVLNSVQLSGATTLTVPSATARNLLVLFVQQTVTTATTGSDNIRGTTGWVANSTHALFNGSNQSVYVSYKTAVGGETTIQTSNNTPVFGMSYFELTGAAIPAAIDTIVAYNNVASATTASSGPVTTTDAILAAVGLTSPGGTIDAWTGSGPMTNISTSSSYIIGGYYIPGSTVSGDTFTANWTSANTSGMLVVAFQPAP